MIDDIGEFSAAMGQGGVIGALAYLNARTPHRFTGIFKISNGALENLFLYDRENPRAPVWEPFPPERSYCSIVMSTDSSFALANSVIDSRVANHPARDQVVSYCGVPLHYPDGSLFGSLCHFDYRPILFSGLDVDFLETVTPAVMKRVLG